MTFGSLLGSNHITIPLFQRAYCWGASSSTHRSTHSSSGAQVRLVEGWWRDVNRSSASTPHRVGKIVFQRAERGGNSQGTLLCIDGQQRATTSLLLLAALRDAALRLLSPQCEHPTGLQLLRILNGLLYTDPDTALAYAHQAAQAEEGSRGELFEQLRDTHGGASFSRLTPSWVDRKAYYECILAGLITHGDWVASNSTASESHQGQAKAAFDEFVQELVAKQTTFDSAIDMLRNVAEKAVEGMALMYIEIINEVNLAQVFLWMQEKALFGQGSMLLNAQPGVTMTGGDMVRNLVLSVYMNEPLQKQEELYRKLWLQPVELVCGSLEAMENMLEAFIEARTKIPMLEGGSGRAYCKKLKQTAMLPPTIEGESTTNVKVQSKQDQQRPPYVSSFESLVKDLVAGTSDTQRAAQMRGVLLYARFVSLVEERSQQDHDSMPPPVQEAPCWQQSSHAIKPPADRSLELVHENLLHELGGFACQYSSNKH